LNAQVTVLILLWFVVRPYPSGDTVSGRLSRGNSSSGLDYQYPGRLPASQGRENIINRRDSYGTRRSSSRLTPHESSVTFRTILGSGRTCTAPPSE
jgi:hypothetical protein